MAINKCFHCREKYNVETKEGFNFLTGEVINSGEIGVCYPCSIEAQDKIKEIAESKEFDNPIKAIFSVMAEYGGSNGLSYSLVMEEVISKFGNYDTNLISFIKSLHDKFPHLSTLSKR